MTHLIGVQGRMLQSSHTPKIAFNAKFDVGKLISLHGVYTQNLIFDPMLAAGLTDEECLISRHALKSNYAEDGSLKTLGMSDAYLNLGSSEFKKELTSALLHYDSKLRRYSKVPISILYPYGCADSDMTLALYYVMRQKLVEEDLVWIYDNLIIPLQHRIMLIELHGVPAEIQRIKEIETEQSGLLQQLSKHICSVLGRDFNVSSTQQLGRILFEDLGLPGGTKTPKGEWAVDDEVLEKLEHPAKDFLLKHRRASKIHGTYAVGALNQIKEITHGGSIGWIHTDYFINSRTGRLRSSEPNLCNLPRTENGGDLIKSMYVAPPGYKFVAADFSQSEMRLVAHISGEPSWREAFALGQDLHAATAHKVFHLDCSVDEVKTLHKAKRSSAKTVNFGVLYGETIFNLAHSLNMTYEEASHFINIDYFGTAPVLKAWIDDTHEFAKQYGYVSNIFGRRRHLPDAQLAVPSGAPWPQDSVRPKCYREGPTPQALQIDVNDLASISDYQYKQQIKAHNQRHYFKCMGCPHIKSCVLNRYKRQVTGRVNAALRQAQNMPVQSSSVDCCSFCAIWVGEDFQKYELDANIILHIHDELFCLVRDDHVDAASRILEYYMSDYIVKFANLTVPMPIDVKVFQRWSEK
jgi:DNA polymerase-1